jgi:NTP pyrophosphatase (non-canonical NTP hydrolase)
MNKVAEILEIARQNVAKNPSIYPEATAAVLSRYMEALIDELEEVKVEIKENNEIYLKDELGDILWNFSVLIALLENRGFLEKADSVFEQAYTKYSERSPAFLKLDNNLWEQIKKTQKERLEKQHQEKYEL